jgi:hypothetical protein
MAAAPHVPRGLVSPPKDFDGSDYEAFERQITLYFSFYDAEFATDSRKILAALSFAKSGVAAKWAEHYVQEVQQRFADVTANRDRIADLNHAAAMAAWQPTHDAWDAADFNDQRAVQLHAQQVMLHTWLVNAGAINAPVAGGPLPRFPPSPPQDQNPRGPLESCLP